MWGQVSMINHPTEHLILIAGNVYQTRSNTSNIGKKLPIKTNQLCFLSESETQTHDKEFKRLANASINIVNSPALRNAILLGTIHISVILLGQRKL